MARVIIIRGSKPLKRKFSYVYDSSCGLMIKIGKNSLKNKLNPQQNTYCASPVIIDKSVKIHAK